MSESLEDLLRRAKATGVTYITMDGSRSGNYRAGAWRAHSHFASAYDPDPVAALRGALLGAITKKSTDLSGLLA